MQKGLETRLRFSFNLVVVYPHLGVNYDSSMLTKYSLI